LPDAHLCGGSNGRDGGTKVTGYESKGRINKRIRLALVDPA